MTNKEPKPRGTIWTYAYQIDPPQAAERLRPVRELLDREHARARSRARTWVGRVVTDERITHILVVSDSPEQNEAANRRLEAGLKWLEVGFAITAPLAVVDDAGASPTREHDSS